MRNSGSRTLGHESARHELPMSYPTISAHATFATTRRAAYQEHPPTLALLDMHVLTENQPLVIVGEPGSGKSALAAYWSERYRRLYPDAFLVVHHVEATPSFRGSLSVVNRVVQEIRGRYSLSPSLPDEAAKLIDGFANWLGHVQEEKLVLVIDGIDQLGPEGARFPGEFDAEHIGWLPGYIPPNVRLILTTRPGSIAEEMINRGWQLVEMQPLDPGARRAIVYQHVAEYGLTVNFDYINTISTDPIFGNALVLRTSISEVTRLQSITPDYLPIDLYANVSSIEELLEHIVISMEETYGRDVVSLLLSLLGVSHIGLSRAELTALAVGVADSFDDVLDGLDILLARHGDLIKLLHRALRDVILQRYLSDESMKRAMHARIGEYFSRQEVDLRRLQEEPWQWLQADEPNRLQSCIAQLTVIDGLMRNGMEYDLLTYWQSVSSDAIAPHYAAAISAIEQNHREHSEDASNTRDASNANVLVSLGAFLTLVGEFRASESALSQAIDIRRVIVGPDDPETDAISLSLVDLLIQQDDFQRADILVRSVLARQENRLGKNHSRIVETLVSLGMLLHYMGEFGSAKEHLIRALSILDSSGEGNTPRRASLLQALAMPIRELGEPDLAHDYLKRAVDIAKRAYGREHPETALLMTELATLLNRMGKREEAREMHQEALRIRERVLGADNLETAQSYNNLAILYRNAGEYELAEDFYNRSLRIHRTVLHPQHHYCGTILHNIGTLLRDTDRGAEALPHFRHALAILQESLGERQRSTAICMGNLGELLCDRNELPEAKVLLVQSYKILLDLFGVEHPTVGYSLNRLAKLEYCCEDYSSSIAYAAQAYKTIEQNASRLDRGAGIAQFYSAHAWYAMKDIDRAFKFGIDALDIFARINEPERPFQGKMKELLVMIEAGGYLEN